VGCGICSQHNSLVRHAQNRSRARRASDVDFWKHTIRCSLLLLLPLLMMQLLLLLKMQLLLLLKMRLQRLCI